MDEVESDERVRLITHSLSRRGDNQNNLLVAGKRKKPRRHSCPEFTPVSDADDHPDFVDSHASGGYCINCPICKGEGCDWAKENMSCGSPSISSLDSYEVANDDTDDCSSITITDSEDERGVSGHYDFIGMKSMRGLPDGLEDQAGSLQESHLDISVNDDPPGVTGKHEISMDIDINSNVKYRFLKDTEIITQPSSSHAASSPPGVKSGGNDTKDGDIELESPEITAKVAKENQRRESGDVAPENFESSTPFEIIETDENGQMSDSIVIHIPSGKREAFIPNPAAESGKGTHGADDELNTSQESESHPASSFGSQPDGYQTIDAPRHEMLCASDIEEEGSRLSLDIDDGNESGPMYRRSISYDSNPKQFVNKDNRLIRKSAVRRKGYSWRNKTFPKNSKSNLKSEEQTRKCASLPQTGSSLELAPSLLNIYDDKAASGIDDSHALNSDHKEGKTHSNHYDDDEDDTAPVPSQLATPLFASQSTAQNPALVSSSPSSSSLVSTSSNVVYRSGKLPSLSQPLDRPVSLMDTDLAISKESMNPMDSKKRPLSVSSMSSVSTSSLPRTRKRRTHGHPRSDNRHIAVAKAGDDGGREHHALPSDLVSESYSSMDSGCVESDRNGERFYDDMSVTSSSEGASVRDDTAIGMADCVDASSSSLGIDTMETPRASALLDRSDSSLSSSSKMFNSFRSQSSAESSPAISKKGIPGHYDNHLSPDVTYPPSALTNTALSPIKPDSSFDEDSYVIRKMGSYINRNSAILPLDIPGVHDKGSAESDPAVSSPEQGRRWGSASRNKARERFYSNYEEHYNKYVSSPVESESSFETLIDSLHDRKKGTDAPSSPSTPLAMSPPNDTQESMDCDGKVDHTDDKLVKSVATINNSASVTDKSPTSPKSTSIKYFDHRGNPSPASPSSLHKSGSSRSSRRRESQDQGSSPTAQVYVSYVQRVVMEIVESEKTYITSLEDIIFGYLEPLETMLNMDAAKDDIMCLFSNIRDIYNFNRCFLNDLEKTDSDPIRVAECFVKHNKGFVIYTDYCTNYPSAVEVLTRFMKHPELSELCKERQMALGHGLPLGAYLLRPVQRILKYHLLLQNIVKNYEKEKKDVPVLKQAFQHMTQMAHHINEMKRKHEHAVRIQEIQSQLEDYVGDDLTRHGDLVLESSFQVYGAKASRQVFLFERCLLITKKKEGGMLSCKTFIECSNLMLVEVIPNEPLSFHAIPFDNPRAQYTLQARNMEQKRRWCQEIKRLILESFKSRIPDNVKNLVMELGRDHDDDFVSKEALDAVRKHQHTAPEYLEKRRVRRKSGSRMPDFSLLRPQKAKRNGQRKNDKPVDSRRAESKSPDPQRKPNSKLIPPHQHIESSSLPTTPVSEPSHQNLFKKSSNPISKTSTPVSKNSAPKQGSESSFLSVGVPKISSSVSTSDVSSRDADDNKENKSGSNVEIVRRASSFRTAIRANPVLSMDLNDKDKQKSRVRKGKRRSELKKHSSPDSLNTNDSKNERISGDDESSGEDNQGDHLFIKEDHRCCPDDDEHNSPEAVNGGDIDMIEADKSCNGTSRQGRMHSRSSSLPALVHAVNDSSDASQTSPSQPEIKSKTDSQSSDNVSQKVRMKGRMSRRDLQDAATANLSGRYIKRRHKYDDQGKEIDLRPDISKGDNSSANKHIPAFHDTFAKHVAEKNALHKAGLSTQDVRSLAYSRGVRAAKLTNWNSVDKLTKGSMCDLSHLDENPWELNAQIQSATSPQILDNSTSSNYSERRATLPSEMSREKDNLDWLVYLKRNSLFSKSSNNASSRSKTNRKSTSVLEQGFQGKEILDLKRRISSQSPYATPPRQFMTVENMKKFGSAKFTEKILPNEGKSKSVMSPLASNEVEIGQSSDPIPLRHGSSYHSRCASSSALNDKQRPHSSTQRNRRPFSLDMERLTDESNKMVAEMEDYISRTSSTESVKSPNKFPMVLPTISIEEQEDEVSTSNNRLSVVSSVSTSSYESQGSSSSDGLAGTLKSKLNNLATLMGNKGETYENICQSPVLTDDEDDMKQIQEPPASPPKSKNTFVPPSPQRKIVHDQKGLQTVLREHSLGSASLGSRMAYSVPIPATPKSEHKFQDGDIEGKRDGQCMSKMSPQTVKHNDKLSPEKSRYSLPATKEAVEALMPPALGDCDIQQSDSGFSIHSNSSNVSDLTSPLNHTVSPHESVTTSSAKLTSSEMKQRTIQPLESGDGLKRQTSYESIDSTDSFYERRLSLALSTDGFDLAPTIVHVYDDDDPQGQVGVPQRRTIREYVQQIEEKFKPESPKVFEVRKRTPGSMIQQKLQSLRDNITHGRHRSVGSRHGSEEREFSRSKSQPPPQYRRQMLVHNNSSQSTDDISVSVKSTTNANQPKMSPSKSRENLYLSRSKEYINLSPSKENLTNIDGKFSLPKTSVQNAYHTHAPGHESDWNSYQLDSTEDSSEMDIRGQFVHKVKPNSSPLSSKQDQFFSSSDEDEGVFADRPGHKIDQLSSEVDNLVIMKGWVKALITKFQDK